MTDRIHVLTVVLEADTKEDDAQLLADAIRRYRGVTSVGLNVADATAYFAQQRARHEVRDEIMKILFPGA